MPVEATTTVPLPALAPFLLLLLAIAVLPLAAPRFWEHNRSKALVCLVLALPVAGWCLQVMPHELQHAVVEYVSFIILLGSLYVVSGGLFLDGDLRASPAVNCAFLGAGAVLANIVGTTGAAMLLVRPLLHTNSERRHVVHTVVFFIFIACNTGGCLTPLGDPPLFVGYLRGVPFTWTLRLWPAWLGVNLALIAVYFAWDSLMVRAETRAALRADRTHYEPLRLRGQRNLVLLAGLVACVALAPPGLREVLMVGIALTSLQLTPREIHESNAFGWGPIVEVAVLFAGIFVTMVPALAYLREHGPSLGVRTPQQFFWLTGSLSGFLDNTPTYLTFLSLAQGLGLRPDVAGVSHEVLEGIALGAVFMGATTYIGNGPNFMVRAIADGRGVKMPGFFGYMLYSGAILVPILAVTSWILF